MNEILLVIFSLWTVCAAAGYILGKIIWELSKLIIKGIKHLWHD